MLDEGKSMTTAVTNPMYISFSLQIVICFRDSLNWRLVLTRTTLIFPSSNVSVKVSILWNTWFSKSARAGDCKELSAHFVQVICKQCIKLSRSREITVDIICNGFSTWGNLSRSRMDNNLTAWWRWSFEKRLLQPWEIKIKTKIDIKGKLDSMLFWFKDWFHLLKSKHSAFWLVTCLCYDSFN